MAHYDVFNGDADGICALHQLRLARPQPSILVTGVKRDIALLARVPAGAGDSVSVLDVSLDKNRDALVCLLARGCAVEYFDHHFAGDIPAHAALAVHIDTSPDVCTSLLVNAELGGAHLAWAVTAAFGDNLDDAARSAAQPLGLSVTDLATLRELGIYLNYNGYGESVEDLFFPPADLYRRLQPYADPLIFVRDEPAYRTLRDGYAGDMAHAEALLPEIDERQCALFILPPTPWARRVSGVYANWLAQRSPERAHALLTPLPDGGFQVSVRAPLVRCSGADQLCREFPTGGGRQAAAGINRLPPEMYAHFVDRLRAHYGSTRP
jgi:hypothetical protein